jgi:hypothetical protein
MAGARGVEGWELIGFFGGASIPARAWLGALCFKRPMPAASPSCPAADGPPPRGSLGDTSSAGY